MSSPDSFLAVANETVEDPKVFMKKIIVSFKKIQILHFAFFSEIYQNAKIN
jgi:hypothetical protein